MKKIFLLSTLLMTVCSVHAFASVPVVATNTVIESVVTKIGGKHVKTHVIASPKRDFHGVTATPKDILRVKKAKLLFYLGDNAEPWLLPLLRAAGNQTFLNRTKNFVDMSQSLTLLEIPTDLSRLEGDIHPGGNPHFWLNPNNFIIMIETVTTALSDYFPEKENEFQSQANQLKADVIKKTLEWQQSSLPLKGKKFISYHRSWSYFADYFGLKSIGEIEPKPGIPTTAKHTSKLILRAKSEKVDFIIRESYFESSSSRKIAQLTDSKAVEMLQFIRQKKSIHDYIDLIEFNLNQLLQNL